MVTTLRFGKNAVFVMARNLANIVGGEDMLDEMMVLL